MLARAFTTSLHWFTSSAWLHKRFTTAVTGPGLLTRQQQAADRNQASPSYAPGRRRPARVLAAQQLIQCPMYSQARRGALPRAALLAALLCSALAAAAGARPSSARALAQARAPAPADVTQLHIAHVNGEPPAVWPAAAPGWLQGAASNRARCSGGGGGAMAPNPSCIHACAGRLHTHTTLANATRNRRRAQPNRGDLALRLSVHRRRQKNRHLPRRLAAAGVGGQCGARGCSKGGCRLPVSGEFCRSLLRGRRGGQRL